MSTPMPWIADPTCGDWVRAGVDPEGGDGWSIHTFVPRGFEAYARVLHPLRQGAKDAAADVRWADVAAAFGTVLTATSNLDSLCRRPWSGNDDVVTPQGEELEAPAQGVVPIVVLRRLATILADHSRTPDSGVVGVWEGIGGLVSSSGRSYLSVWTPRRWVAVLLAPWDVARRAWWRYRTRPGRPGPSFVAGVAPRDPDAPGTGILDAGPAAGPRLDLPYRSHILFAAGIASFTGRDWVEDAPWLDDVDRHQRDPQTPAVFWPDDRAWFVANDTDDAWTFVAGSRSLVEALVADPDLEAFELPEGAVLDGADPPVD
jgi:hypothetical protein